MPVYIGSRRALRSPAKDLGVVPSGFGVFGGDGPSDVAAFSAFAGRPVKPVTVFIDRTSWTAFANSIDYYTGLYNGYQVSWGVPLVADGGSFAEVIAGARDALFRTLAQKILAATPPGIRPVIRLGWELNQDVWAWYAGGGNEANYIAAFQRVAAEFRAVSPRFAFNLNINYATSGTVNITAIATALKPLLTIISNDVYWSNGDSYDSNGAAAWGYVRDKDWGPAATKAFAVANNLIYAIDEMGVRDNDGAGHSLIAYTQGLFAWILANGVAFANWWEGTHGSSNKIANGDNPLTAAEWLKYFGIPTVTNTNVGGAAQNVNYDLALTTNQDGVRPITWSVVSGAATIVAGSTLRVTGAPAGNVSVAVQAVNDQGWSAQKTITVTFVAPYVFSDSDAAAWIAARPTSASETLKSAVDQLVIALKASTAWAKARDIFVAVDTAAASNIGLKLVATRTNINGPVFTPWEGFSGLYDGTYPRYSKLGIVGQTPAPATLNSIWMLIWERTNVADNSAIGLPGSNSSINPRTTSNTAITTPNDWGPALSVASTDSRGIYSSIRSGSAARRLRKNGVTIASDTQGSNNAPTANEWMEGGSDYLYPSSRQQRAVLIGSAPTDAQEAATVTALQNFYAAVGAAA